MQVLSDLLAAETLAVTDEAGTLDRQAFVARVAGLAAQLRGIGVTPGSRVGLWLPNSADHLAVIFAVARLGAVAIHINTRYRANEVGHLLRQARPAVLVTQWGFAAVDFAAILGSLPLEERATLRCVIGRHLPADVHDTAGLPAFRLDAGGGALLPAEAGEAPEAACLTFTTSGTTSGPKLVLHTQRGIASHAAEVMRRIGTDQPGAAFLAVLPLCGTFGNAAAMAAAAGGAHIVCMERFDPGLAAGLIRRHGITHCVGSDDMLGQLAAAGPFTTMRFFGFGAFHSNAAAVVAQAVAAGLAPVGVYGSSEIQALFAIAEGRNTLLGGGRPVCPTAAITVRHPETGAVLPAGQPGELCVDAPSRFVGYLDNAAATARATAADGSFRTGDLARVEGDGFVYLARMGDALRLGGFLVNPEEIEGFLHTLPGVAGAQVVAAVLQGDAAPVAFVVPHPGEILDEATLLQECRAGLARYKVPVRIAVVAAFPVTDSSNGVKIQRVRLREMAMALLQETVG